MPVEDELVLAADEVAEDEWQAVATGPFREHRSAALRLADVVRRCGEVDEKLRAGCGEVGGGARLPDVLADRHADAQAAERQHEPVGARLEVALLVEDAVVGEEPLPVERPQLAPDADGTCVRQPLVERPRRADERDDPVRRRRDLAR